MKEGGNFNGPRDRISLRFTLHRSEGMPLGHPYTFSNSTERAYINLPNWQPKW